MICRAVDAPRLVKSTPIGLWRVTEPDVYRVGFRIIGDADHRILPSNILVTDRDDGRRLRVGSQDNFDVATTWMSDIHPAASSARKVNLRCRDNCLNFSFTDPPLTHALAGMITVVNVHGS